MANRLIICNSPAVAAPTAMPTLPQPAAKQNSPASTMTGNRGIY